MPSARQAPGDDAIESGIGTQSKQRRYVGMVAHAGTRSEIQREEEVTSETTAALDRAPGAIAGNGIRDKEIWREFGLDN